MLIGISVGLAQIGLAPLRDPTALVGVNGIGSAVFYLAMYGLATLGTFAALTYLGSERRSANELDELAGLSQTHPGVAAAIAVFMFSLAGLPPLAGFWGKFTLFSGAIDFGALVAGERGDIQRWFLALAIIGVVNAAIAAAYDLRVVATMYFGALSPPLPPCLNVGKAKCLQTRPRCCDGPLHGACAHCRDLSGPCARQCECRRCGGELTDRAANGPLPRLKPQWNPAVQSALTVAVLSTMDGVVIAPARSVEHPGVTLTLPMSSR